MASRLTTSHFYTSSNGDGKFSLRDAILWNFTGPHYGRVSRCPLRAEHLDGGACALGFKLNNLMLHVTGVAVYGLCASYCA